GAPRDGRDSRAFRIPVAEREGPNADPRRGRAPEGPPRAGRVARGASAGRLEHLARRGATRSPPQHDPLSDRQIRLVAGRRAAGRAERGRPAAGGTGAGPCAGRSAFVRRALGTAPSRAAPRGRRARTRWTWEQPNARAHPREARQLWRDGRGAEPD